MGAQDELNHGEYLPIVVGKVSVREMISAIDMCVTYPCYNVLVAYDSYDDGLTVNCMMDLIDADGRMPSLSTINYDIGLSTTTYENGSIITVSSLDDIDESKKYNRVLYDSMYNSFCFGLPGTIGDRNEYVAMGDAVSFGKIMAERYKYLRMKPKTAEIAPTETDMETFLYDCMS